MTADLVIDHLWQSTLVASVLALLTLAFRRAHAQSALRDLARGVAQVPHPVCGTHLTRRTARMAARRCPSASPEWTAAIDAVRQPLGDSACRLRAPTNDSAWRTGIPLTAIFGADLGSSAS